MVLELDGRVAIVTGGSSGIGAAIVSRLRELGATAIAFDRDVSGPGSADAVQVDVSDGASVSSAVDGVVARLGGLDIVVNCAGVGAQGTVVDNDDDEWHRVLDVNLLGVVRVSRAALPYLESSATACIVNITSVAATVGLRERALYSASKGAVDALTRAMAADLLGKSIRVNAVAPGTVDTPWIQRVLDSASDRDAALRNLTARQPHGRLVAADEIAHAVAYLVGPGAGSTTGATLAVDGGMSAVRV